MRLLPGEVRGRVQAPPSKSATIRAIAAASLAKGTSTLVGPSRCLDALAATDAFESLGALFDASGESLQVRGCGNATTTTLRCGESALLMRMLAPIAAALAEYEVTLEATGSLVARPMDMIEAPLRALGARCSTAHGRPPVRVQGPLTGGRAVVDASASSQLLTGLLFALPLCACDSELEVPALASRQYVTMTLAVLSAFGVVVEHDEALRCFRIPGRQRPLPTRFEIEGDWSAAAFLLVAGAIAGEVQVTGLRLDTTQPDACILGALASCGASVDLSDAVGVSSGRLAAFAHDLAECPDLLPPLAVLACHCRGTSELSGIGRARLKESDRVEALCHSLGALGAAIEVDGDCMRVTGGPLRGGVAESWGDHRIAMAVAIASLGASAPVELLRPDCVAKSFPDFFETLRSLVP